jgi:cell wall-associated NlpC family hydrolase
MIRRGFLLVLLAAALSVSACASSGAVGRGPVPQPFPGARTSPDVPAVPDEPNASNVPADPTLIATALKFTGVPYRDGGSDPSGFDCSGFVQYVFAQHGIPLPREVREQFSFGESIDVDDVRAGDLIFFTTVTKGASHVGLAIGGGQFVHAPSSRGRVRVERFTSGYWEPRIVGIRRLQQPS